MAGSADVLVGGARPAEYPSEQLGILGNDTFRPERCPMTTDSDPDTGSGAAASYTRSSVEEYLRAAAAERVRLQMAIAEARDRTARALAAERWLDTRIREFHEPRRSDLTTAGSSVEQLPHRAAPRPSRPQDVPEIPTSPDEHGTGAGATRHDGDPTGVVAETRGFRG